MRKTTEEDVIRVCVINLVDKELIKRGFKHGLDYDEADTFTDDCLQEIEEIEEILTYQFPTLENEIRETISEIEWDIRNAIEEWF